MRWWFGYLGEEVEVEGASAVGGDILHGLDTASTHDDLRPVGKNLVGGIPSSVLQLCALLHPIAVAVAAWSKGPNLHSDPSGEIA